MGVLEQLAERLAAIEQNQAAILAALRVRQTAVGADEWLSARGVARRVHKAPADILDALRTGALPAVRMGRRWRVKASAVDAWLARGGVVL